jgi:pimeloyl-ACP methyl ester carboxylesterase
MTSSHPAQGSSLHAFAIRGLAGGPPFYFSQGMDTIAQKLVAAGVPAEIYEQGSFVSPYGMVPAIAAHALRIAKSGARPILLGHSMGADAALKVATALDVKGVPVPLVVCFDPTSFKLLFGPPPVPKNVSRAICFYQKITPLGRGILKPSVGFKGTLVQERRDSIHSRIDDDPQLHARVLTEVRAFWN